jgi:hypothetical protein
MAVSSVNVVYGTRQYLWLRVMSTEEKRHIFTRRKSVKDASKSLRHRDMSSSPDTGHVVLANSPERTTPLSVSIDSVPREREIDSGEKEPKVKEIKPHIREKLLREVLDTELDYINDLGVLIAVRDSSTSVSLFPVLSLSTNLSMLFFLRRQSTILFLRVSSSSLPLFALLPFLPLLSPRSYSLILTSTDSLY